MDRITTLLASLFLTVPVLLHAQAGSMDPTFNGGLPLQLAPGSIHDNINEMVALPDTTVLFCGTTYQNGGIRAVVGHVLQDGTLDPDFGTGGYTRIITGASSFAYDMVVDAQGRIVVCGITNDGTYYDILIARLLADGSFDTSFDNDGILIHQAAASDDVAEAVVLDGNKIVIGGSLNPQVGFSFKHTLLMRFNDDGSVDNSFGTSGMTTFTVSASTDQVNDIALLADGSVVGAGYWYTTGNQQRGLLVKVDADGQPDATFGTNGVKQAIVGAVGGAGYGILSDGMEFIVTGDAEFNSGDSDGFLARFSALGVPVTTFGTSGKTVFSNLPLDVGSDLVRTSAGGYLVTGSTGTAFNARDLWTHRFDVNGMVDPTFGSNGVVIQSISSGGDYANAVDVQPDGKIVVGGVGVFTNNDMIMLRYLDGSISTGLRGIEEEQGFVVFPVPCEGGVLNVTINALDGAGTMALLDMQGRILHSTVVGTADRTVPIDVNSLAVGTYLVELATPAKRTVRPIVIAR